MDGCCSDDGHRRSRFIPASGISSVDMLRHGGDAGSDAPSRGRRGDWFDPDGVLPSPDGAGTSPRGTWARPVSPLPGSPLGWAGASSQECGACGAGLVHTERSARIAARRSGVSRVVRQNRRAARRSALARIRCSALGVGLCRVPRHLGGRLVPAAECGTGAHRVRDAVEVGLQRGRGRNVSHRSTGGAGAGHCRGASVSRGA